MNVEQQVYLVDDDLESLDDTARLIRSAGYLVKTFESGADLLRDPDFQNALCLVFEMNVPDLNGLDLQEILATRRCRAPVIFIAGFATVSTGVQAIKAGAIDFLCKPLNPPRLLKAIEEAAQKQQKVRETAAAFDQFSSLTQREQEVFGLVTRGMLNKQIAAQLGIAEKTIKVHRGRVMKKMAVRSVADLVRLSERIISTENWRQNDALSRFSPVFG